MPHIGTHFGTDGPIIDVTVGVSALRAEVLAKQKQMIPSPCVVRALIDTGASCSSVDGVVCKSLGLSPTGVMSIFTPSTGKDGHESDTYDVSLKFKISDTAQKVFNPHPVVGANFHGRAYKALIGRDILSHMLLIFDGPLEYVTISI